MDLTNILNNSSFEESRSSESENNHAKQKHQKLRTPSPILEPLPVSTSPIRQQLRQQTNFLNTTTLPNNYTHRKPMVVPERMIRTRKSTRASSLASIASSTASTESKNNSKLKKRQIEEDSGAKDNLTDVAQAKPVTKKTKSNERDRSESSNSVTQTSDEEREEEENEEGEEDEENSKTNQKKKDNKTKRNKAPNSSWSPEEDGKLVWTTLFFVFFNYDF